MNRILAIIPARGGSKGVPGKNLRPLAGKPLVVWTIEQALGAAGITDTVVTTDAEDIAAVARAGRRQLLLAGALAVTVFIVPILPALRADMPVLAALHPVGALLAFVLAVMVAVGATRVARSSDEELGAATAA